MNNRQKQNKFCINGQRPEADTILMYSRETCERRVSSKQLLGNTLPVHQCIKKGIICYSAQLGGICTSSNASHNILKLIFVIYSISRQWWVCV